MSARPPTGQPEEAAVKFILIVVVVAVLAFLVFKYVLPRMNRH